jgi:conjugal transfer mating pair stabilization protein TraG
MEGAMKQAFHFVNNLYKRLTRTKRRRVILSVAVIFTLGVIAIMQTMPTIINPGAYKPLLAIIAKGESGGNYNAYFGNGGNTNIKFTGMTIDEVLKWQEDYVRQGEASNAVGKYQFMGTTLAGLIREQRVSPTAPFNEAMQDRLAIALIDRRGAVAFAEKKISREQFAHNLSQEWAALPRVLGERPTESYYAGDGLNAAKISIDEIMRAIDEFEKLK